MLASFRVPIIDDRAVDSGEIFGVMLSNVRGNAQLARAEGIGIIFNHESETDIEAAFREVPASHDGGAFTVELAFGEMVEVNAASLGAALEAEGGTVTDVAQRDADDTRYWRLGVAPSGAREAVTLTLGATAECGDEGAVCTSDGRYLKRPVRTTVGTALALAGTPTVSGAAQAGRALEASFAETPAGQLAWQWLRGGLPIEGATASRYTPTASDVGHALSARARRGGETATTAATAPVWPAASHPAPRLGEDELFSTTLTLASHDGYRIDMAGYARLSDGRFGEIDATALDDGGTARGLTFFAVNAGREFGLATDPPIAGDGLVAYWNGHRIADFETQTAPSGETVLAGNTPQAEAEVLRYTNGSADGVRVGVTLRRAYQVTRIVSARVTSGPGENGIWDVRENVEAEVRFNAPVWVVVPEGRERRRVEMLFDVGRRKGARARYKRGSGTDTLTFRYTVDGLADGATEAVMLGGRLQLNRLKIVDANGRDAVLRYSPSPRVESAALAPDGSGDRAWTAGETLEARLTFDEAVTVEDGTPRLGIAVAGEAATLDYASGSGSGTLVFSRAVTGSESLSEIAVTAGSLALDGARIVSTATGMEAAPGNPGTEATAAPGEVTAGVSTEPAADGFTVAFLDLPGEHDGSSAFVFEVKFSEEPKAGYGFAAFRDHTLDIRQGGERLVPSVERLDRPNNHRWAVTVTPSDRADIALSLGPKASCEATGAVCTADGEALSNTAAATVPGPPGLSVADARAEEAADATLDFEVTLSRASTATVTVDYQTSDGTASAGVDYRAASGTLSFAPGETGKTVRVEVLDDDHDEGEETFTLTLSNPQGGNAWLADATAEGTIENSDAMPRAWLARFGRTVADQVVDAVEGRLAAPRRAGVEVSLAGRALKGATAEEMTAFEKREAERRLEAVSRWLAGDEEDGEAGESRALTGRDFVTGTSFALTGGSAEGGFGALWGRGALSRFDGREGGLTLSGEVTGAMLGAEFARGPGMLGLMFSNARGEGSYRGERDPGSGSGAEGKIESALTGVYPYGRYRVNERVTLWGVVGYAVGELTLTPKGQAAMEAGMDLAMGAVGVRGVALAAPAEGGLELAITPDAMVVQTSSERTAGLAAAEAEVTRFRLGLEGSWRGLEAGGATLVPRFEVGARHDGGDAETGIGVDVGGGLSWSHPQTGLSAELSGRGLLSHEADGFRDRGFAGSLSFDPRPRSERGLSLSIAHTMGVQASGGMAALFGRKHLAGMVANDAGGELGRRTLEVRLGYGFGVFEDRFTATPEAGLGFSGGQREYRLGWRLEAARRAEIAFELGLEATRREAANDDTEPVQALMLRGRLGW